MKLRALALGVLWSGGASACGTDGVPLISSDQDAPHVEMFLDDMQLAQPFSVKVIVCGDKDIHKLVVDAEMPAHQHGMNYIPTVVDLGEGAFRVDGMLFHMPGVWEIQMDLYDQTGITRYTQTTELQ
ncbi:MAG: hypothetical protein ABJ263_12430 [Tateyamaria sp.]|uniref:hypothetical protein n=1 Tax=Roseobacteraceae TaxID=2854170 RepID=UPI00329244CC